MAKFADHFTTACNGDLFDTRNPAWPQEKPLRKNYSYHFARIDSLRNLKASIRAGRYIWPGGYEFVFVTSDGGTICRDCVLKNFRGIADSTAKNIHDGWNIRFGFSIAETDSQYNCDCCGYSFNGDDE